MVYLSKIYTRTGDRGTTRLADNTEVRKDSPRLASYGAVDELNACIGLIRLETQREPDAVSQQEFLRVLDDQLARIQQELFNLGAELATPGATTGKATIVVRDEQVARLEQAIDEYNERLLPLKSFILPGGGPVATTAHLARTVCRRAERLLVKLAGSEEVRPQALQYLNRLSDYLFVVSRAAAGRLGHPEVLWDPKSV